MARYIDADAIHKFVDEKVAEGKDGWKNGVPYEWAYALTIIDNAPTADVAQRAVNRKPFWRREKFWQVFNFEYEIEGTIVKPINEEIEALMKGD